MRTVLVGLLALTSCAPAQTRAVQVGEKVYTVEVANGDDSEDVTVQTKSGKANLD